MKTLYYLCICTLVLTSCTAGSTPEEKVESKPKEKHGIVETFREDGSQIAKVTYDHGKRNGVSYNYYPNGNVKLEINYINDEKQGMAKWFYESGKLYMESNYIDGKKDGIEKRFFENGVLQAEIPYRADQLCVGTKEYNSKGKLIKEKHTMQIEVSNTVSLDRQLTFKVYMPKVKDVEYYVSDAMLDGDCLSEYSGSGYKVAGGVLEESIYVPESMSVIGELIIYAKYKSFRRIPHLVRGKKRFAIDN